MTKERDAGGVRLDPEREVADADPGGAVRTEP